jgi:hypothetical protein
MLILTTLLLFGVPTQPAAANPDWWDTHWQYRQILTFDNSGQSENLVDFPVLVNLTEPTNIDYTQTQDNGEDIRFVDSDDATELSYEIEEWDENGDSWVWVKVPQIDGSSNTDYIYMYYGNPDAPDGQNAEDVWDGSFKLVTHMNDDPDNANIQDSTVNNNDGTKKGADEPAEIEGKIGRGQDFDGTDDKITVSDSPSLSFTGNQLTIEAWVKVDTLPGTDPNADETAILRKDEQWQIAFQKADTIRNLVNTNGTTGWTAANDEIYPFSTGTWYYWTFVYNGSNICHLIDAQQVGDLHTVTGNIIDNSKAAEIGRCIYTNKFLNGIIDEVRISDTDRSDDWIEAQYLSMTDNFITYTNQPPFAPTDLGPSDHVDGSWIDDNTPTFNFDQRDHEGDKVKYRIQLDDDSNTFPSPEVDYTSELLAQGGASFTVGQAADGGSYTAGSEGQTLAEGFYYWRVKSIDDDSAESEWAVANGGEVAFRLDFLGETGGSIKDRYITTENVRVAANGFMPGVDVHVYVVNDYEWTDGDDIPPDGGDIFAEKLLTADGDGQVKGIVWEAPLEIGEYDVVFDADNNGNYNEIPDLVDDPNHPGFIVVAATVGGTVHPVDKAALWLPWLILSAGLILATGGLILTRRADRLREP